MRPGNALPYPQHGVLESCRCNKFSYTRCDWGRSPLLIGILNRLRPVHMLKRMAVLPDFSKWLFAFEKGHEEDPTAKDHLQVLKHWGVQIPKESVEVAFGKVTLPNQALEEERMLMPTPHQCRPAGFGMVKLIGKVLEVHSNTGNVVNAIKDPNVGVNYVRIEWELNIIDEEQYLGHAFVFLVSNSKPCKSLLFRVECRGATHQWPVYQGPGCMLTARMSWAGIEHDSLIYRRVSQAWDAAGHGMDGWAVSRWLTKSKWLLDAFGVLWHLSSYPWSYS